MCTNLGNCTAPRCTSRFRDTGPPRKCRCARPPYRNYDNYTWNRHVSKRTSPQRTMIAGDSASLDGITNRESKAMTPRGIRIDLETVRPHSESKSPLKIRSTNKYSSTCQSLASNELVDTSHGKRVEDESR